MSDGIPAQLGPQTGMVTTSQPAQTVPAPQVPALGFDEAIKRAEGLPERDQTLEEAVAYFESGLKGASEKDYEKKAQFQFYLLLLLLRKNIAFETPKALTLYTQMHTAYEQATADFLAQLKDATEKNKKMLLTTQILAFYRIIERNYTTLERLYTEKGFEEAKERIYVARNLFRMRKYTIEKNVGKYMSLKVFQWLTVFGTSFSRWTVNVLAMVFLFAIGYAVLDVVSQAKLVTGMNNFGFDYLYYSAVSFTSLGVGDYMPVSIVSRVLVMCEVFCGYIMLGMFIHILLRRV